MVHDDCALLIIDFRINPRISDQVDNPLLSLILVQPKSRGKVLNINSLVNLAVALRDKVPGGLNERIGSCYKEEIGAEHFFCFRELLLGFLEVEIDVQRLNEVCNRVVVLVVLLFNNADDVLELLLVLTSIACAAAVRDYCCCEVSEDPRAGSLNGIDEWGGKEQLANGVARWLVVEEREQSPVDQPCSVGELRKWVVEKLGVDRFLHLVNFFHGRLPIRS